MLEVLAAFFGDILFLAGYIGGKTSFPPPLSAEDESSCLERMAQGDEEARRLLIEHNLRLVCHIAKKYSNSADSDDMISIGAIGLIKAVATFKPHKGSTLATYASRCIENEILMSLRQRKKTQCDVSLSEPIGLDRDGSEITLLEVLCTDEDDVEKRAEASMAAEKLRAAMDGVLSKREKAVVALRYGLAGGAPMPQREIASLLGISRSYVSRIEKKAVARLRARLLS